MAGGVRTTPPYAVGFQRRRQPLLLPVLLAVVAAGLLVSVAGRHHGYDLEIYRGALRAWMAGTPLYDYAHPGDSRQLGFTYPPFAALVFAPLALVPAWLATGWQALTGAAALVFVVRVLAEPVARRLGFATWYAVAVALPVVVLLEPVRDSFSFGQINLQLAALIVGDVILLQRGSRWAGVGIGLAAAVKLTPAILLLHLLLTGRRRAVVLASGVAAGATLVAAAVAPATSWDFWTRALWDTSRVGAADSPSNQALSGLIARLAEQQRPPVALWLVTVTAVAGFGLWRARRADRRGDLVAGLTLAGVTGLLVSPISWIHHLWWVIPVLAVLAARAGHRSLLAAASLVALFSASLPDLARVPLAAHRSSLWTILGESALCLALLAVLALLPTHATGDRSGQPALN